MTCDIFHLAGVCQEQVRNREEENDRLLEEINGYRDDIDNMMETFRGRERELLDEIEMLGNKNRVITNLLDMVTERTAQSEGGSSGGSTMSAKSEAKDKERSASTVSALSDVSVGSDDVFAGDRNNSNNKEIDVSWGRNKMADICRYFQTHFLEWKIVTFDYNFNIICP